MTARPFASILDSLTRQRWVTAALVVQTPGASGRLAGTDELRQIADAAHDKGALVIAACDLLALTLTTPQPWGPKSRQRLSQAATTAGSRR